MPEDKVTTDPTHDDETIAGAYRRWQVQTKAFGGNDKLTEITAAEVQWAPGPEGRNQPVMLPGTDFVVPADIALLAVGFERTVDPNLAEQLGLITDADGGMYIDRCATSIDGVFAAGDTVSGPALVANAIHSGRKTAAKIDAYLNQ